MERRNVPALGKRSVPWSVGLIRVDYLASRVYDLRRRRRASRSGRGANRTESGGESDRRSIEPFKVVHAYLNGETVSQCDLIIACQHFAAKFTSALWAEKRRSKEKKRWTRTRRSRSRRTPEGSTR